MLKMISVSFLSIDSEKGKEEKRELERESERERE
jgi:hypothetical protein